MINGTTLIQRFERFASPQLAEKWDHVGLQVGDPDQPLRRLMTSLDVRPETVAEAIDQQVDLFCPPPGDVSSSAEFGYQKSAESDVCRLACSSHYGLCCPYQP
jgi:Uncharacterized conserved protein